jgi:hypothetical protein
MYLGYKYPYTSFHQGFNINNEERRYDFGESNHFTVNDLVCGLIHLSTYQWIFDDSWRGWVKLLSQEQIAQLRMKNSSELWRIMESVNKVTNSPLKH